MTSDFIDAERERVQAKKAAGGGPSPQKEPGTIANSAMQRLLSDQSTLQRKGDDVSGSTVDDDVAQGIEARRGGGQGLDAGAREKLEGAFEDDFSDVRVHTDGQADTLNKAVNAEAFTTGRDIFFRAGAYNPGSAAGQRLLAHELTHVVQQRGATNAGDGMRVSDPTDTAEREADSVADQVTSAASAAGGGVAREAADEEELQTSIAREVEEEEELQMSVARQMPEEEELQTSIARELPEEEELQTSVARQSAMEEEEEPQVE